MNDKRFLETEKHDTFASRFRVITDTETGVQYLYVGKGYGGGLTVLVDENGKPLLDRNYKNRE